MLSGNRGLNQQEQAARDFGTNKDLKTQKYLVYFKFLNRIVGTTDPPTAADDLIFGYYKESVGLSKKA